MAYEKASGKELSEDQKATATEELVTTGDLAKDLGQDTASDRSTMSKNPLLKIN